MKIIFRIVFAIIALLLISCESKTERQNKEWQERMEQEGEQLQKDVDHAIGKDDAVYSIKNGGDN